MKIFLVIPFTADYKDIGQLVRQAVQDANHQLIRMDEMMATALSISEHLHDEINKADLIIADISDLNPNVMYELGVAQSLGKPIIPISRKGETVPFDIASIRVIFYDRSRLNDTLSIPLRNYLAHSNFDAFLKKEVTQYEKEKKRKKTVFVSYSHVDIKYLERLKVHLKPFEKQGLIDLWSDTKIKAGEKWKEKIEKALEKSAIAILLISADFLASDFIVDNELPPLLKSAEDKGKIILPVIVKPCRFTRDKNLSKFQSINDPKIPLSKMFENDQEEVYVEIADYIDDSLK